MTLIDDRGRILGRYNLVDVALAVVLLGLIPLGYAAYALFRVPVPRLTAVEPSTRQFEPEFRVTVRGENLRPYMRVSLNDMQGRTFLFQSATSAEVVFGDVPPGTYDVVLYDYAQERGRLLKAFTLAPAALPPARLDVAGFLTGIDQARANTISVGLKFGPVGEVIAAGKPGPGIARLMPGDRPLEIGIDNTVRVPVVVRINCDIVAAAGGFGQCVAGQTLAPSVYLKLPTPTGQIPLLIVEVRPTTPPIEVEVQMRLDNDDPAYPLIKAGDVDVGYSQIEFAGGGRVVAPPSGTAHRLTLRLPAYKTLSGWLYALQPLRVGAPLTFVTTRYQMTGILTAVPALPPTP